MRETVLEAVLRSADAPSEVQRNRFAAFLKKQYGQEVPLRWEQDPALEKGFRMEVGADLYDWSLEGRLRQFRERLETLCGREIVHTIKEAEPFGPKKLLDALVIMPCTGNTLAKLAAGIADGPVTLAAKAHLRNERPVIVAVSTNDALAGNAANLGTLLNRRGYFFVPFGQDSAFKKPRSLVADFTRLPQTVESALRGEQVQPILYGTPVG